MRPFSLTSSLLLLVASSVASPLMSRDVSSPDGGLTLVRTRKLDCNSTSTNTTTTSAPGATGTLSTATPSSTGKSGRLYGASHAPKLNAFKASRFKSWIEVADPGSLKRDSGVDERSTEFTSTGSSSPEDPSYQTLRPRQVNIHGLDSGGIQASGIAGAAAPVPTDAIPLATSPHPTTDTDPKLNRFAASAKVSWINWPGRKRSISQLSATNLNQARNDIPKLNEFAASESVSWIDWSGKRRSKSQRQQ